MKSEDFERLKSLCEKEGFEILNLTHDDNEKYVLVKKEKKRVQFIDFDCKINTGRLSKVIFEFYMPPNKRLDKVGEFLALKLEEYLNK